MTESVGYRLEQEFTLLSRHTTLAGRRTATRPLEHSAYLLLWRLELGGPMTLGDLADSFGLDVSTVNRQSAALIRQGLAERIPDPAGGLARLLRPTHAGLDQLESMRTSNAEGVLRLLSDWPREDLDTLVTLLRRLNVAVEEHEGLHWPRD